MKILYLSPNPPWPPNRGSNQRSNLLQRALSELGHVDLYLLQGERLSEEQRDILQSEYDLIGQSGIPQRGQRGAWKFVYPLAPGLVTKVAHNMGSHRLHYQAVESMKSELDRLHTANGYDLVVGRYLMPTALSGGLDLSVPSIVDIDDVDTQKYVSRLDRPAAGPFERGMLRWHILRFNREVPRAAARANHLWLAADADINAIQHSSRSVLRNIPFADEQLQTASEPPPPDSKVILSVTSMNFPVNERAVDRFVFHVWPRIRVREPNATFVLVGSQMTESQRSSWSAVDGVTALGFVEDLATVYRDAAFTVVPIFEGGGTKIKVLESLLYGRTSVVAEHSVRGYEHVLKDGDSISISPDEEQLAEKCLMLLQNQNMSHTMAAKGKGLVLKHFSYHSFRERVATDVRTVLDERQGSKTVSKA